MASDEENPPVEDSIPLLARSAHSMLLHEDTIQFAGAFTFLGIGFSQLFWVIAGGASPWVSILIAFGLGVGFFFFARAIRLAILSTLRSFGFEPIRVPNTRDPWKEYQIRLIAVATPQAQSKSRAYVEKPSPKTSASTVCTPPPPTRNNSILFS